jgi:predicted dehydrogenase
VQRSVKQVNWGVLGLAKIARLRVIPAIQRSRNGRMVALASRSAEGARETARALRVPRSYGGYETLLRDPGVTAVYLPLPNALHREWTIRAAEAGKHVLCEKPLAVTAKEGVEMAAACRRNGVRLMEAYMYRFHPHVREGLRLLQAGVVGRIRLVKAAFSFVAPFPEDIRWRRELGGGALLDSGCYGVDVCRAILGEPVGVAARAIYRGGVVETVVGTLHYGDDALGVVDASIAMAPQRSIEVVGTEGRLAVRFSSRPGWGVPRLEVESGRSVRPAGIARGNHYRLMVEAFADAVLDASPVPLTLEDSLADLRILDALQAAVDVRDEVVVAGGRPHRLT